VRDRYIEGPSTDHKPLAVSNMTMAKLNELQASLHNFDASGDCSVETMNDRIEIERVIRRRGWR
jgi:hypothetical protein